MVLTSLPGTIFDLRASEVSDVVAAKQQPHCACCAGPKSLFGLDPPPNDGCDGFSYFYILKNF